MRGKKWWFAAEIALVLLLAVAVNVVAVRLSARFPLSLDLTADNRYALSGETRALLGSLDRDVDICVLAAEDSYATSTYTEYAAELLKQYPKYGRVSVIYVDFARDPTFAARYPELELPENGLLISSEGRAEVLETADLFEYSYTAANEMQVTSVAEAKLAGTIASVASDSRMKALVLTGNGAQPVEGLQELLKANNFDVREAPLAMGAFDLDADVAILAAPTSDLTGEQVASIEAFLEGGGEYGKSLFYAADVTQPALPNLEALLREWGVAVDDGAVFETSPERTYQSQPFFATVRMVGGALAEEFAGEPAPVIAPMARPLTVRFRFQEGYTTEALLQFSETSGVRPSDA
ncbi:MAG: GldG family protein, partial [Clostridiales bacterium]|nr:GldG family protein [Clostridiales bacterium]